METNSCICPHLLEVAVPICPKPIQSKLFHILGKGKGTEELSNIFEIIENLNFKRIQVKLCLVEVQPFLCHRITNLLAEAGAQRCYVKKVFLEISQNSQENTSARVSFLIKL